MDEGPRSVYVIRTDFAQFDKVLHLRDGYTPAHSHQRIEVSCGLPVNEISVPVALPGADESEVGNYR